jgi:hypothetical protein
MGLRIFVGLRGMDIRDLQIHLAAYRRAWRTAGHAGEGNVVPTEQVKRSLSILTQQVMPAFK